MVRKYLSTLAASVVIAGTAMMAMPANALDKLTLGVPGVPPIFADVVVYVAKEAGFFKKYGIDVEIRGMNSGAAAAKAVVSGSLDASLSPSQFVVRLKSNAGVPVRAIWGFNNPDWLIGSMDKSKANCEGLRGGAVGVDSKRGARWIQLNTYLARKCKMKIEKDVSTVPLGSGIATAIAAGQLTFAVLHLDDIVVIERETGKKVHIISTIEEVAPGLHYLMMIAREETIAKKKDQLARAVAALRDAAVYMADPANVDEVAKIAGVTKRTLADAKTALGLFLNIGFWPQNNVGLDKSRIEKASANQARVGKITKGRGGIKPGKTPVTYEQMVDLSVWAAAEKMKK